MILKRLFLARKPFFGIVKEIFFYKEKMSQLIHNYLDTIISEYKSGVAREHTYRPALKDLLESTHQNIKAHNEPSRESC